MIERITKKSRDHYYSWPNSNSWGYYKLHWNIFFSVISNLINHSSWQIKKIIPVLIFDISENYIIYEKYFMNSVDTPCHKYSFIPSPHKLYIRSQGTYSSKTLGKCNYPTKVNVWRLLVADGVSCHPGNTCHSVSDLDSNKIHILTILTQWMQHK